MNIVEALHEEESKLQRQLTAIQGAITALKGGPTGSANGKSSKRTMSPEHRARISRATKARWAKYRVEKASGKRAK